MQPDEQAQAPAAPGERRAALLASALACVALGLAGYFPVNNADSFGHLAQGRQIAELGHVPARDLFSFWQPEPAIWHNYEWLSDLASFELYRVAGWNALIVQKCALLGLTAILLALLAFLLGGPRVTMLCALLLVMAIPGARFRLTERPHLLALPFAAFYLLAFAYLARAFGRGRRAVDAALVLGVGVVHLLWVNLHGSHLLGLALAIASFACNWRSPGTRARIGLALGLQLAASCVSPFGPAILADALKHMLDPAYRVLVTEWAAWQPSDPLWLMLAPVLQTLLLAFGVRPLLRRGAPGAALFACACLLAAAAFRSIRFVAEYLLLSSPVIALGFAPWLERMRWSRLRAALLGLGGAAAIAVPWGSARLPPFFGLAGGQSEQGLPAASGMFLKTRVPHPRVLAAIEDSWYLMFAAPNARFLVDGRVPFYGPEHIQRVRLGFASPRQLAYLLEHYRVNAVVPRFTFKSQHTLLNAMRARPDFRLVSLEDRYAVFLRSDLELTSGGAPEALPLEPSYELAWLLAADPVRERVILGALGELPAHENTRGYRGFVRAVLALRPLLRPGENNGIRPPATPAEVATLRNVRAWLARAAQGAEGVPALYAYHALTAAALCQLDEAERALELARAEGDSRETLLGAQEIAVRRHESQAVADFLGRAAAVPRAASDAWLAALREELADPPRCP